MHHHNNFGTIAAGDICRMRIGEEATSCQDVHRWLQCCLDNHRAGLSAAVLAAKKGCTHPEEKLPKRDFNSQIQVEVPISSICSIARMWKRRNATSSCDCLGRNSLLLQLTARFSVLNEECTCGQWVRTAQPPTHQN